jgi:hypothetical protein
MGVGPTVLRGRVRTLTYVYDDPTTPERPTAALESPAFTVEDRCLLLGLEAYEASLCPGPCGMPREVAWHSDMDGWLHPESVVCLACTALRDGETEVAYSYLVNERTSHDDPLPPFKMGETTLSPSD